MAKDHNADDHRSPCFDGLPKIEQRYVDEACMRSK